MLISIHIQCILQENIIILMYLSGITKRENTGHLIFEEGDIVLAKCNHAFPEPAIVQSFRGFDAQEQEIYKVKFFGQNWAYLPAYFLQHLRLPQIKDLCIIMKRHMRFNNSLKKAELYIRHLGSKLAGKFKERYDEIYLTEKPIDMEFFGDPEVLRQKSIQASMASLRTYSQIMQDEQRNEVKLTPKQKRYNKCKFQRYLQGFFVISQKDKTLKISSKLNNMLSSYQQEIQQDQQQYQLMQREAYKSFENVLDSESTNADEGSVHEGQHMDNELFKSIVKESKQGFEDMQKYLSGLKEKNGYQLEERFYEINGINCLKLQSKIKQLYRIMSNYKITPNQITLLYQSLSRFMYIFVEYHSGNFLMRNIFRIRQLVTMTKDKRRTLSLEKMPVLSIYELTNKLFTVWLSVIETHVMKSKSEEGQPKKWFAEQKSMERLKKNIMETQQKYEAALEPAKKMCNL